MPKRPPQSADEARLALETFNAKFEKVKDYSFFRKTKFGAKSHYDFTTGEGIHTVDVAEEEQIDAALLSLRFFFVNNEPSSIDYLPATYALLGASKEHYDKILDIVAQWDAWKLRPSVIAGYDNYRFFEIMIYGNRLHRNAENTCKIYDGWMAVEEFGNYALVDFCNTMHDIIAFANAAYWVNKEVLR